MSQKKLIVVAGPTAVGKTRVALELARHFNTAVVSADSRQVYREMNIGTAKPSAAERALVPHYCVDTHSVGDDYDAAAYAIDALRVISELFIGHDHVILCGGSGLYIRAVCEGLDEMPEVPPEVRVQISANYRQYGLAWLQEQLRELDPAVYASIDRKNPQRLMRALEVRMHTGRSILSFQGKRQKEHDFRIIKIGLDLPREELYDRINARMDAMIADGLFEEARDLYPLRHHNALQTVGYQEIFGYLEHLYDHDECVRLLKRNTRRYAKRQLTWFRKDGEFRWFSPHDPNAIIRYIESTCDEDAKTGNVRTLT